MREPKGKRGRKRRTCCTTNDHRGKYIRSSFAVARLIDAFNQSGSSIDSLSIFQRFFHIVNF